METDLIPGRIKAARSLTQPTPEEVAARDGKQRVTGITAKELAARIDRARFSYSRLRNIESGIGSMEDYELAVVAQAVDVPPEFFTISPLELYQRVAGANVRAIPGATGRRVGALRPSQGDHPQLETLAGEENSHGEL